MKLLICRTIIIYLCVLFAMRLMGKRQLGELQPEELVSTILISNLASISIESEEVPITSSLIPLFLIAALELLGSVLSFRSQKFFNFLSGRPKTVILDGQIDQNALRMLRLTTADLMEALRGKNIFDPREVSYAVIETNGTLSVALRPEKEPARLADLQGLTLRVQESDMMSDMVEAMGAVSVQVVYSDVYAALHNRKIDGAENNWPSYEAMSHYEVAPYFLQDEHTRVPEIQISSRAAQEKLAALDASFPAIVQECARESAQLERRLWAQREAQAEADLRAWGVEVTLLSDAEKQKFRDAVQPLYDQFSEQAEMIRRIQQA